MSDLIKKYHKNPRTLNKKQEEQLRENMAQLGDISEIINIVNKNPDAIIPVGIGDLLAFMDSTRKTDIELSRKGLIKSQEVAELFGYDNPTTLAHWIKNDKNCLIRKSKIRGKYIKASVLKELERQDNK